MARLMIATAASADPFASEAITKMGHASDEVMSALLVELPGEVNGQVTRIVNHVWRGELSAWVNGRLTIADVFSRTEEIIRFVLSPYETAAVAGTDSARRAQPDTTAGAPDQTHTP